MSNEQKMVNKIVFPDEIEHLAKINRQLDESFQEAERDVNRIDREYRDSKCYMSEYRGEIDPHEMFQNELLLRQTDHTGTLAVDIRDRIAKLKESPYFARIDFQSQNKDIPSEFYIGRFAFRHKNELLIFDWRAPVAGMFYDYEIGPAGYDAPMGRVEGVLTRKRQFHIQNGVMEYALESSAHIQDDILQKELSQNSEEKMKSIIATIQKEQNQIIRNEKSDTLIIQGVAGSGKTSIALHRIAFLLYRFKKQLSSKNVTILSPNKVFGDYISNVIPELGEEPIFELSFYNLADMQLKKVIGFESDQDPLEVQDRLWMERVRFKSTLDFVKVLDAYINSMPDKIFVTADYAFGRFTANGEWIQKRFRAYGTYPVKQRLIQIADDIYQRFDTENIREEELPKPRVILRSLTAMLQLKSSLALYKDFYRSLGKPDMFVMPAKNMLEWGDVYPFLYLHAAFEGVSESSITKHLVIDEMQDYTPIQYTVINRLFPCKKTILGDFGQFLNPCHVHALADIKSIYETADFVELNKSYRSTYEIMNFAKRIVKHSSLEAIERHGEKPVLNACKTQQEELQKMKKTIRKFEDGENTTLGIILKTNQSAERLYGQLQKEFHVNLISPESTGFAGGVSVTSIRMAKGLEFDEVIVCQVDSQTYSSEHDRSLLYIACTRAMHRLSLSYTGEVSPFLNNL